MTSTPSQKPTREDFVRWGTAPEDRQCRYQFANGYHCRRWSIRGHEFCHKHGVWMATRVDGPIEIPLLEDPTAVQFVATQTVRALSWGHIPPANGRAILHGCRVIQAGFAQQLAEARFRLKCHRLGVDANQFLPARPDVPEHRVGNPAESVILSEARSAESKDLHSSPEDQTPHFSPVLEEAEKPGAPFKPSSGLSGLDEASHPPTLDLQASIDPQIDALTTPPVPPHPLLKKSFTSHHIRRDQGDLFRKRNLRVPHPCPPAVGGQGGLSDRFTTDSFSTGRFSANPKLVPSHHIRRDQGDLFRKTNLRVPHPCPPAVGGQGGLADRFTTDRFSTGRFLAGRFPAGRFPAGRFLAGRFPAGRFPANPKLFPSHHIRRDQGDLFRKTNTPC